MISSSSNQVWIGLQTQCVILIFSGAVWSGDNKADWSYLKISIPMLLTISLAGISFCGGKKYRTFQHPTCFACVSSLYKIYVNYTLISRYTNLPTNVNISYILEGPCLLMRIWHLVTFILSDLSRAIVLWTLEVRHTILDWGFQVIVDSCNIINIPFLLSELVMYLETQS